MNGESLRHPALRQQRAGRVNLRELSQIKTCQPATAYAGALASLECSFMPQSLLASRLLALLNLTSLGEDDSPIRIRALCASACTPYGQPAAVCVYPEARHQCA